MYYVIYKITNQINGKFYIGKHQTEDLDDAYMGSGRRLNYAFKKYGIENFTKEYLEILDSEEKMNLAERILVVLDEEVSYNLCSGGKGGWGYINKEGKRGNGFADPNQSVNREKAWESCKLLWKDPEWRERNAKVRSQNMKGKQIWLGKKHSKETIKKMKASQKGLQSGSKNSQFGKMWITNGVESRKIMKDDLIPEGWRKGRKL
jgi:hypothetical protein